MIKLTLLSSLSLTFIFVNQLFAQAGPKLYSENPPIVRLDDQNRAVFDLPSPPGVKEPIEGIISIEYYRPTPPKEMKEIVSRRESVLPMINNNIFNKGELKDLMRVYTDYYKQLQNASDKKYFRIYEKLGRDEQGVYAFIGRDLEAMFQIRDVLRRYNLLEPPHSDIIEKGFKAAILRNREAVLRLVQGMKKFMVQEIRLDGTDRKLLDALKKIYEYCKSIGGK